MALAAHLTSWPPGSLGRWAVRVGEQKTLTPWSDRDTGVDPTHPLIILALALALTLTLTLTLTRTPGWARRASWAAFWFPLPYPPKILRISEHPAVLINGNPVVPYHDNNLSRTHQLAHARCCTHTRHQSTTTTQNPICCLLEIISLLLPSTTMIKSWAMRSLLALSALSVAR